MKRFATGEFVEERFGMDVALTTEWGFQELLQRLSSSSVALAFSASSHLE